MPTASAMQSNGKTRSAARRVPPAIASGESPVERKLRRLGLVAPQDFVVHFPIRYEDETRITSIASLRPGQSGQVEVEVLRSEVQFRPRRQLSVLVTDGSGDLVLRWLNFYSSQQKQLAVGKRLRIWGELRMGFQGPEMVHPKVSRADVELPTSLTPVYSTTDGLSQASLRRAIDKSLETADLDDTLGPIIRQRYGLMPFGQAAHLLHHPPPDMSYGALLERSHPAWRRVKFDELLAQQLSLALARAARLRQRAEPLAETSGLVQSLRNALPFRLTAAQERVTDEISSDLMKSFPMHRLLQGDVGSGKTVVAALAAAQAIASGAQVAIMAPTEILAEQHLLKLAGWLEPLGVRIAWLTGRLGAKSRREENARIASGEAQLIIGTQALIQDKTTFAHLGLIVLDEQHRFGVGQRLQLSLKGEKPSSGNALIPHQLSMSATPIPRTLAMTFFADLDSSVIDELPPGRRSVVTKLVADSRRSEIVAHVQAEIFAGKQAYWVCPLVEESEALQLQTAVDTHARLVQALPDLRIGLVHGRLKSEEKASVMADFRSGRIDVLIATTVIEVGVDVANASLMVIEHAERFGLAQLHQLRGRVGRGSNQSVCVLMYQQPLSWLARQRLRAMYETTDGFEIARRDLRLRGPGEFLGVRQSGLALLRFANLETDVQLVEQAQALATELLDVDIDTARRHLARWMHGKQDFLRT
ncbi:MAG: ATP-dependent DNA helicase RecG [Burkholderiaceae bacterium]|nr:MAG: ATP-dependent DNA helicase RecG [Burkholderiaceae bacterium]